MAQNQEPVQDALADSAESKVDVQIPHAEYADLQNEELAEVRESGSLMVARFKEKYPHAYRSLELNNGVDVKDELLIAREPVDEQLLMQTPLGVILVHYQPLEETVAKDSFSDKDLANIYLAVAKSEANNRMLPARNWDSTSPPYTKIALADMPRAKVGYEHFGYNEVYQEPSLPGYLGIDEVQEMETSFANVKAFVEKCNKELNVEPVVEDTGPVGGVETMAEKDSAPRLQAMTPDEIAGIEI